MAVVINIVINKLCEDLHTFHTHFNFKEMKRNLDIMLLSVCAIIHKKNKSKFARELLHNIRTYTLDFRNLNWFPDLTPLPYASASSCICKATVSGINRRNTAIRFIYTTWFIYTLSHFAVVGIFAVNLNSDLWVDAVS